MSEIIMVGIAGGSGCGKSTLAYGLQNDFPKKIEVVHFDDYQKKREEVPIYEGMSNWDHPQAINFDKLLEDLRNLKEGKEVDVLTKSEKYNPDYEEKGRIPFTLKPKPLILIEGYMILTDERVREFLDYKIFLDLALSRKS